MASREYRSFDEEGFASLIERLQRTIGQNSPVTIVADWLGVSRRTVYNWTKLPSGHPFQLEAIPAVPMRITHRSVYVYLKRRYRDSFLEALFDEKGFEVREGSETRKPATRAYLKSGLEESKRKSTA